jgi:hypothetical protein
MISSVAMQPYWKTAEIARKSNVLEETANKFICQYKENCMHMTRDIN